MKAVYASIGFAVLPATALAHTGGGSASGLIQGFTHPLLGVDHVAAMVAVGLLAARIGGAALWLVPISFVVAMTAGGVYGFAGFELPFVEVAIGFSVLAFGAALLLRVDLPVSLAACLVGGFAVFHGHAHGAEMPFGTDAAAYVAGFLAGTMLLHGLGLSLGIAIQRRQVMRIAGGTITVAGLAILTGLV